MRTASTRQERRSTTTARGSGSSGTAATPTPARRLPTPEQLLAQLPGSPVPERQRAAVTAAALRATIAEWQQEADGSGPRTPTVLAAAAGVPLGTVRRLSQRGSTGVVPAGVAARLLWAMGEPLRADLRQALADDLAEGSPARHRAA